MKIEFLRLDLHLKRKQKKNHKGSTNVFIREERKNKKINKIKPREEGVHQRRKIKKKKNPETVARRPGSQCDLCLPRDLGSPRDLGHGATWVRRATWVRLAPWVAVRPGSIARGLCRRPGSGAA